MSDTQKSHLHQFLFLQIKDHYEVPEEIQKTGFNDNYNLHMIYIIIIWFISLLLLHTQSLLVEQLWNIYFKWILIYTDHM